MSNEFNGVFTALITPFRNGEVDFDTLTALVERQITAGVNGLVPVGTTGESPTLDTSEHIAVIEAVVAAAKGRVPVIAGTGANATREALQLTREADRAGADAFLQVAPYYNKPSQDGLFAHFSEVARATAKPIVLYSIPGRCGVEIGVETVRRLASSFPHVRTVKEAGGTVTRVSDLRAACGENVTILCGDDGLTLPFIACGASGVVSVATNVAPNLVVRLTRAALAGDFKEAESIQREYHSLLTEAVFLDGNPVTVKEVMHLAGILDNPEVRLPLVRTSAANRERLREALLGLVLE